MRIPSSELRPHERYILVAAERQHLRHILLDSTYGSPQRATLRRLCDYARSLCAVVPPDEYSRFCFGLPTRETRMSRTTDFTSRVARLRPGAADPEAFTLPPANAAELT